MAAWYSGTGRQCIPWVFFSWTLRDPEKKLIFHIPVWWFQRWQRGRPLDFITAKRDVLSQWHSSEQDICMLSVVLYWCETQEKGIDDRSHHFFSHHCPARIEYKWSPGHGYDLCHARVRLHVVMPIVHGSRWRAPFFPRIWDLLRGSDLTSGPRQQRRKHAPICAGRLFHIRYDRLGRYRMLCLLKCLLICACQLPAPGDRDQDRALFYR